MKYTKYSDLDLKNAVKQSISFSNVLRLLGMKVTGGNHVNIKHRITKLGIDCSHFTSKNFTREVLVKSDKGRREHAYILRRALMESGIEYKCSKCNNNDEWQGEPIILQVDHIDNDWSNHELGNLRFLCPNCHSQISEKYKQSKKKVKIRHKCIDCPADIKIESKRCKECSFKFKKEYTISKRPSKDILQKLVWEKPIQEIASEFDVCHQAVYSWCQSLNIEKPPRKYWCKKRKA